MSEPDLFLSIVIPLYNEEDSVRPLLQSIEEALSSLDASYEILLIDDGSTDGTWRTIEKSERSYPNLRAIKFRRNFGQTAAMVAGFDHARGKYIATMDGDLQNDPADIPRMLKLMEKEGWDIVSGWRKDRKDHFSRVLPSRIANFIISKTTGVHLHDYGCSLKIYRAHCIRSIHAYGEMHRFFPALASMTGARVVEMPVNHYPRRFGKSKYGFNRIFKVFSDIFSMNLIIRFSSNPLTGFFLCTVPFIVASVLFGILGVSAILLSWTEGKPLFFLFATALSVTAVFHLLFMGILGEMVVGTSDLSHTQMPELTKKTIDMEPMEVLLDE